MDAARPAVWLDSYRSDLKSALQNAARDGYRTGVVNTGAGGLDPREFSTSARRHLTRFLRDLAIDCAAISVEFPEFGLADAPSADARLERLRSSLGLCAELRVPRATTTISGFDDERAGPLARELLPLAANLADQFGVELVIYAGTTGTEPAAQAVRRLGCAHVRIGLDTAHLASDLSIVTRCADAAGLIYLRDVRTREDRIEEVPFGTGEIDFAELLVELGRHGFGGPFVVRRDAWAGEVDALRRGREYIALLAGHVVRDS